MGLSLKGENTTAVALMACNMSAKPRYTAAVSLFTLFQLTNGLQKATNLSHRQCFFL